jgi:hypothetical protein
MRSLYSFCAREGKEKLVLAEDGKHTTEITTASTLTDRNIAISETVLVLGVSGKSFDPIGTLAQYQINNGASRFRRVNLPSVSGAARSRAR